MNIEIRKLRKEDIPAFVKSFNDTFPSKNNEKHVSWQYFNNPYGVTEGVGAFKDGELISFYGLVPVPFKINNQEFLACRSPDGFTHPIGQKKGLFKKVGQTAYKWLESKKNIKVIYGFSNSKSVKGVYKYFNRTSLDPLPFLFRIVNTSYINRKLHLPEILSFHLPIFPLLEKNKGFKVQKTTSIPNDIDVLWGSFKDSFKCGIIRNRKFLVWRYQEKPEVKYHYFECRDSEMKLKGFGVMRIAVKHGGCICYIMELMSENDDREAASMLLNKMLKTSKEKGVEIIIAWMMEHHFLRKVFLLQGFHPLPKRLLPVKLYFGANINDENYRNILLDRKSWFLSYTDSDSV